MLSCSSVVELGKKFNTNNIVAIAENKEKYISFTIDVIADQYVDASGKAKEKKIQFRFIDSLRFMASSLDSLTNNLVGVSRMVCGNCGGSCEFTHVNEIYIAHGECRSCYSGYSKRRLNVLNDFANLRDNHTDEQFRLLLRKGVYPYEYMSSWDKFEETKLPPKDKLYANLNISNVSKYYYEHAQKVWKVFGVKNLGEYHDLYLNTDAVSNVFEAFRNTCLENYKLDLAHFYIHGLDWLGKRVRKNNNRYLVRTLNRSWYVIDV